MGGSGTYFATPLSNQFASAEQKVLEGLATSKYCGLSCEDISPEEKTQDSMSIQEMDPASVLVSNSP